MILLTMLAAGALVLASAACSGDDGKDDEPGDKASDTAGVLDPKEQKKRAAQQKPCTAEVSTTGAYDAEWDGKAVVRTGGKAEGDPGPKAVYTLTDKKNRVALYSPGSEFKGSVSLSVGEIAYSSDPADAGSFEIDKRGKQAHVEATLTSTDGETVDLVADFTCGKKGKKNKKTKQKQR
jgi:hypothetical protein